MATKATKKVKYLRAIVRHKDSTQYEHHLFKGYPTLKSICKVLRSYGCKISFCEALDEETYNIEAMADHYLFWES